MTYLVDGILPVYERATDMENNAKDRRHAVWSIKIKPLPTKRRPLVQRRRLDHLARGSAARELELWKLYYRKFKSILVSWRGLVRESDSIVQTGWCARRARVRG